MTLFAQIPLKNRQILGCVAYEILSVPEVAEEGAAQAQKDNETGFYNLLGELYRYSIPDATVLELLWSAQPVQNQPHPAQLHLYAVLRMICPAETELSQRITVAAENLKAHLEATGVQFCEISLENLQKMLPDGTAFVNAVTKSERCTMHAQGAFAYYFVEPLPPHGNDDFSMLSRTMAEMPGSAVSFQLLPTRYTLQESSAVVEMQSLLTQITTGTTIGGQAYRDPLAQPALQATSYVAGQLHQPVFAYNILILGTQSQCAALTAQVINVLRCGQGKNFITVNLNAERLDLRHQFAWYPWTLNQKLIRIYRNAQLWKRVRLPQALFRLPALLCTEEATTFFRLPLGGKNVAGVRSHKSVQNVQHLDDRVVDSNNILFGTMIGGGATIGCPPESLTKHMLVVGKPGTGKTTFSVNLLLQLYKKGIPFLAVEPTKTEYRAMIDAIPDLQVFTPGSNGVSPFVINPFIPPRGITVEQFIPSLVSAFKAAFSMPSPLDTIFQAAIQEAYVQYGWRDYSTAQDPDVTPFGLHEFILVFKNLIAREKYSAEVKGNLQSGGVLRLRNLIEQNANIYDTTQSVPLEDILAHPTVLELNAIDNEEQKSVLMALLLINICVYTKHNHVGDGKLKNAILIDEAHVLFKAENSGESGSATVRSLENMLAEIRSYGTSIIIADQSPAAVGAEVVKNTEVKTIFQLVDVSDRKTIATTTNMTTEQETQIPRLGVGEAFISYGLLAEPALVQTPDIREEAGIRLSVSNEEVHRRMTYWDSHAGILIPFLECTHSVACQGKCDLKLRSDASFYAARFAQMYGEKITDAKSLCAYARAIDGWLDAQTGQMSADCRAKLHNCAKIRLIRRMMQQRDIPQRGPAYEKMLQAALAETPSSQDRKP